MLLNIVDIMLLQLIYCKLKIRETVCKTNSYLKKKFFKLGESISINISKAVILCIEKKKKKC